METRVCIICQQEKPFHKSAWKVNYGKPSGNFCASCINKRYRLARLAWRRAQGSYKLEENKQWYRDHPEVCQARNAKRRAAKLQRNPPWADQAKIRAIYRRAIQKSIATGIPHHVDHVIPLQGKLVSGLHVETNLKVIPATKNLKKQNSFTPT